MSDVKQPPSSGEQMIPKSRLDEIIAERNALRNEIAVKDQTVHTLSHLVKQAQAPQRQVEEDPVLKELKENNPALYHKMVKQEAEIRQLRGGLTAFAERQDRSDFLAHAGKPGEKRLAEVEKILEEERRRNNFQATRLGIYTWLLGQERLQRDAQEASPGEGFAASQAAAAKAPPKADDDSQAEEIPSSDPRASSSPTAGTASVLSGEETREERIKKLEHLEF